MSIDVLPLAVGWRFFHLKKAGPASYAVGGFAPGFPNGALLWAAVDNDGKYHTEVDYANKKIKVSYPNGGHASGTNDGLGGAAGFAAGGADSTSLTTHTHQQNSAKARELAAAVDLSTVTFRMVGVVRS